MMQDTKGFKVIRQLQKILQSPSDYVLYDFMTIMEYFNKDKDNTAIIACRDTWISTFNKCDSLDQFDMTHVTEFVTTVRSYSATAWRFFEVVTDKWNEVKLVELN